MGGTSRATVVTDAVNALARQLGLAADPLARALQKAGLDPTAIDASKAFDAYLSAKGMPGVSLPGPATPVYKNPPVDAPALEVRPGGREPISGRDWTARPDSYVHRKAMELADSMPPELAARIRAGDVDAMYEAVRRGAPKLARGQAAAPEDVIRQVRAELTPQENIAQQFERAVDLPTRQMELPLSAETAIVPPPVPPARELATTESVSPDALESAARNIEMEDAAEGAVTPTVRGPGVPVGGPRGPGRAMGPSTALVPAEPRGLTVTNADAPDALEAADTVIDASPYPPGPLPEENVFAPEISQRPRLGYQGPRGPGVPVGGVARERPTGLIVPRRKRGVPAWAPAAAGAAAGGAALVGALRSGNDLGDDGLEAAAAILPPDEVLGDRVAAVVPSGVPFSEEILGGMSADDPTRPVGSQAQGAFPAWKDMADPAILASIKGAPGGGPGNGFGDPRSFVTVDGVTVPSLAVNGRVVGDGQFYQQRDVTAAKEAEEAAFDRAGGRHGVPGPRTDDGRPVAPPPEFGSPEEAEAYYVRQRDPQTGKLMPSRADAAMTARGMFPVFTPSGEISYSMAADYDGPNGVADHMSPAARRYAASLVGAEAVDANGNRTNIRIDADKRPIFDPRTGKPQVAQWEQVPVRTPFGDRMVLRQTAAARESQAKANEAASISRIAQRTGMTPEKLADMTPQERGQALRNASDSDYQNRRALVARNARLAGGSQNLNAGVRSRIGTLDELGNPNLNDWQRMVLAETMLRAPQEVNPLGVQGAILKQAAQLANNANVGSSLADRQAMMMLELRMAEEARKREEEDRAAAGGAFGNWWNGGRDGADRALRARGVPYGRRQRMLEDMFGPEDEAAGGTVLPAPPAVRHNPAGPGRPIE